MFNIHAKHRKFDSRFKYFDVTTETKKEALDWIKLYNNPEFVFKILECKP